jgi:hypothetical protein
MSEIHAETLLAAGYAVFLLLAALGLDGLARHTLRRSERYRTSGFTFHDHLDAWECPEGEHLHRAEVDRARRQIRYRASPQVCNACPVKEGCTDSDSGREIARPMDPWPHSEAGRFHRAISVVLGALASLIVVVAMVRNPTAVDLTALAGVLALTVFVLGRMASAFRATPANFPG